MRILFLSFYFSPDLSAGSFRSKALLDALLEKLPEGSHIDVVTTLPNRYSSFSSEAPRLEERDRVTIHRIQLPSHKSGMVDQSWAFLSYLRGAWSFASGKRYDMVYATSSRLMTASLGAALSRRMKVPLYLDIRDIFVDTIKDVLSGKISFLMKGFFSTVERMTLNSASRINLVSPGFVPYFEARYPGREYSFFTNGIDNEFLAAAPREEQAAAHEVMEVVYAGNMGEGQGLHAIIPQLAKRLEGRAVFKLIGDGGRRQQLVDAVSQAGCTNVHLLDPVGREELIGHYQAADILFLHLNDYPAFRKVLPSKIFEYAALGKPVWAGIAGYSASFVNEHVDNAAVFDPCDVEGAVRAFEALEPVTRPREDFLMRFSRHQIMAEMADDVLSTVAGR